MAQDTPSANDNTFFDWMRGLGIPRQPGWIGGVCAGIAARLGIDAIIVRGIVVVIAVLGGPALLLYAAAWLLLPDSYDRIHLQEVIKGNFDRAIAGIGAMFLLSFIPIGQGIAWGTFNWFAPLDSYAWAREPLVWGILWTLAIIASTIWLIVWLANRSKTATPRSNTSDAAAANVTDSSGTASSAMTETTTVQAPEAPPAPPADAGDDDLAAWKEQQANWKREHDAWKQQQAAGERELRLQRAAEDRRLRQEQSAERHRAHVERERRTRSNPLYSLVAIGLAIVAGAATALVIGGAGWDGNAAITGMAVTLGVLGLAIVVNGFRGKRSGGASGVAFLVVIALAVTSALGWINGPLVSHRTMDWQPTWAGVEDNRTVLSGDVVVDVSSYFDTVPDGTDYASGSVTLFVVSGDVDVIMPADAAGTVDANATTGEVHISGRDDDSGAFATGFAQYAPREATAEPSNTVHVGIRVLSGTVRVSQAR